MTDPEHDGDSTAPAHRKSTRRPRAPTITIDTTPGDQEDEKRDEPTPLPGDPNAPQLRASHSFDTHRPTSPPKASSASPHNNISSPSSSSKWPELSPHGFLAVPKSRSRGNSVDSDEHSNHSPSIGGETSVTSFASTGEERLSTAATNQGDVMNDENALKADPGTEDQFKVENNTFAFTPGQLGKLFNPKSLAAFYALGGTNGLEKGLRTDLNNGLSLDEKELDGTVPFDQAVAAGTSKDPDILESPIVPLRRTTTTPSRRLSASSFKDRKRIFNDNTLPEKKPKSILQLAWIAYNDKVLILLTVAAIISLALGIYQSVTPQDGEAPVEWVEGVAIIVAIVIVVVVGAANDWQKERQFVKLNRKKDDRNVNVIRSGKTRPIPVQDILVGDVMHLEPGDLIPVDGIFITGHNVKCDESSATGESDLLRKTNGEDSYDAIQNHHSLTKIDPFIISGAQVEEGVGNFLVTAVGVNSSFGKTLLSLREDPQVTPLQSKLNILAEYIAKLGLTAGLVLFVATFIKFLVSITGPNKDLPGGQKGQQFLQVFIVAVTIIVVAVPEGLPLAVTLALAFATTRMLKDNNLVRLLRACETMGNATTICSDKTGTLTQNRMSTVAGTFGMSLRFGDKSPSDASTMTDSPDSSSKGKGLASELAVSDRSGKDCVSILAPDVKELLQQSIALNSTAFESETDEGKTIFIGSKTETALLNFAHDHLGLAALGDLRMRARIMQMVPFDSRIKCMAVVVQLNEKCYRLLVKGASEIVLAQCTKIIKDATQGVSETKLMPEDVSLLKNTIDAYASRSLRTIGLLYKDFDHWPPRGVPTLQDDPKSVSFDRIFKDMTFLGVVGLQDPLRLGVADAVAACKRAGVFVRMVTGDNVNTAKAIAGECGIYREGGMVMEGPQFRKLSQKEMHQILPNLQVLARSSPEDKRILVQQLKDMGQTVAVTGDGTNDAPALKTADVGFSMGIAGTEVAKEASDIILMDDNFASIVKAIMWGRAVNDSVKKFLQFQLTVNIVAVILTFVSAVADDNENSVLTAVQLLWVNLIMDTFAALALATDPPAPSILDRPPEPRSSPLVSITMWKMIIGQTIFQLAVTLILYFAGDAILSYQSVREHDQLPTLIFNVFVWLQIVNQYNCRRIDNHTNIFEGILKNYFFMGIQIIIAGGQILIVFVGGRAFSTRRLNGAQWGYSIILPLFTIPIGMLIRLIPDDKIRKCIPSWFAKRAKPKLMISDEERQFEWNPALEEIREELQFLKMLRGGRLTALRYKLQHPRETLLPASRRGSMHRPRSRTNSMPSTPNVDVLDSDGASPFAPSTPESRRSTLTRGRVPRSRSNSAFGPAAAMAGIVAGSIAGWSPIDKREEESANLFTHSAGLFQSRSRALSSNDAVELPQVKPASSAADESTASDEKVAKTPAPTPTLVIPDTSSEAPLASSSKQHLSPPASPPSKD